MAQINNGCAIIGKVLNNCQTIIWLEQPPWKLDEIYVCKKSKQRGKQQ